MSGESHTTTDHETIRKWVEKRGGLPAAVEGTGNEQEPGILRISFSDTHSKDSKLSTIGWDDFFEKFEEEKLAFLYQDKTKDGKVSRFFKFVNREKH
jgi:hypothetical protein